MSVNGCPKIIKKFKKKYLLGLVRVNYMVEDRRPDLSAEKCIVQRIGKYKHYIEIGIVFYKLSWIFRTDYEYNDLPYNR